MIYNRFMKLSQMLLVISGIFISSSISAQGVGIGTTSPNSSALLDLDASSLAINNKKGVLLPRVALKSKTDIVTIANPAVGLLVYNTTVSATDTSIQADTFYFWNGTTWTDVSTTETIKKKLYAQVFIVSNTGNQAIDKTGFNNGVNQLVTFDNAASGAMVVDVGNRVSLINNNFKILSTGTYEITGYVGYNPWVETNCTTYQTEATCTAALDFILQRSTDNGGTWSQVAKSSTVWGVRTGDRNRSVIVAPFVISLNENDLIRAVVGKGSATNHGAKGLLYIEAGTGLSYSRLLRFQKLN